MSSVSLETTATLESRYLDSCKKHRVLPNSVVLSWLYKASLQKCNHQTCTMVIFLDQLEDADLSPLVDVFLNFQFDAVSILCESSTRLCQESILSLMHAASLKLHIVDLQHVSFQEDFLCNLFQGGINCHMLKLRSDEAKTFNIVGTFALLHTLNLDFCSSLSRMEKDFFANMPNLMRLSLCGTRVADLWTTSASLSRLTCLVELRFQNCMCCKDTGPCPAVVDGIKDLHGTSLLNRSSDSGPVSSKMINLLIEVTQSKLHVEEESKSPTSILNCDLSDSSVASDIYCSQHFSPICFEKHYREFMITVLPQLKVLDNLPISELDREMAKNIFSMHFEYLPYKRQYSESITSVLHMRETGMRKMYHRKFSGGKHRSSCGSQIYHSRSLCAAKYGSSAWPIRLHLSHFDHTTKEGSKTLRPRQFEYHPSDSSLMAIGTLT